MAESVYLFTKKVIAEYLGFSKDQVVALMKERTPIAKNERGDYKIDIAIFEAMASMVKSWVCDGYIM